MLLTGRTALVTGAGRGIGLGIAKRFLTEKPARLFCADLNDTPELQQLREQNAEVQFVQYDQGDLGSIVKLFKTIEVQGKPLYAAALSAIHSKRQRLTEADDDGIERTIRISVTGTLLVLKRIAQSMIAGEAGGRIVFVGSPHSEPSFAVPCCISYNCAKSAMRQAMLTSATELQRYGITVNEVVPGWTDTPGEEVFQPREQMLTAARRMAAGRLLSPSEVAEVAALFLDPRFEMATGSSWGITGGVHLPHWSQRDENGGV